MEQICISSDVTFNHLSLNKDDLHHIDELQLSLLNSDKFLLKFGKDDLQIVGDKLKYIIDNLFLNRKKSANSNIEVKYEGYIYSLDFRNSFDFHLCTLISLYEMVDLSLKLNGSLYIFNKDVFKNNYCNNIISFLRANNGLSNAQVIGGIKDLWSKLKIDNSIDNETVENGLIYLQKYGMVFYDTSNKIYFLTARGYLYW